MLNYAIFAFICLVFLLVGWVLRGLTEQKKLEVKEVLQRKLHLDPGGEIIKLEPEIVAKEQTLRREEALYGEDSTLVLKH